MCPCTKTKNSRWKRVNGKKKVLFFILFPFSFPFFKLLFFPFFTQYFTELNDLNCSLIIRRSIQFNVFIISFLRDIILQTRNKEHLFWSQIPRVELLTATHAQVLTSPSPMHHPSISACPHIAYSDVHTPVCTFVSQARKRLTRGWPDNFIKTDGDYCNCKLGVRCS